MDDVDLSTMTKAERKAWVHAELTRRGIPEVGRQVHLTKYAGVSKPTAQAILRGSLPRDMRVAYRFVWCYKIEMLEWISGRKESKETRDMAISVVRAFERERQGGEPLTDKEFCHLVALEMQDPNRLRRFMEEQAQLFGP